MNDCYAELVGRFKEASLLGSCSAILGWDERTYMPRNGAVHRGNQVALLARICYESQTHPRVGELLGELDEKQLGPDEAADVREIRRSYLRLVKVPKVLVEELARTASEAQGIWQTAKETNNFSLFCPWLEKIVALKRREAEAVGYDDSPYDALVDEFEPGARTADLRKLFSELAGELSVIVQEVTQREARARDDVFKREFSVEAQESICREIASMVGFDFESGRLDSTSHPFCSGIGPGDCRILTRYHRHRPLESFFGTLHEVGHGLYEQGLPHEKFGTPLGMAASFGIHESQSRLWENQVGRSRAFWEGFYPKYQRAFANALGDVSLDQFLRLVNDVKPSLIRIDADEVTYNLHIILRFELEVALMNGELLVGDLPGAWNERFQKLFGQSVPDDARGCLQDIHWSFGGIGYFPTYTLGNLYAAQFMQAAERDIPTLWSDVRSGQFAPLSHWLRTNIHCHGQRYRPRELCKRVTGSPPDHRPFLNYLRRKFLAAA